MDLCRFERCCGLDRIRSEGVSGVRRRGLKVGLALLLIFAAAFIALPVASLFIKSASGVTLETLRDPVVTDALTLSLFTATTTVVIVIILGTPLSYLNARFDYPGKEIADSLIELPVVMPPMVGGIALLMAFGRMGVLGQHLHAWGVNIAFTTVAVVVAQIFVSMPFYLRQARISFEDVDLVLENAARTLGASRTRVFFSVTLPIATNGLISGAIMSFARALGEFGATIMFAGNFQGRTQTMPLAIYTAMQGDLNVSLCLALILVAISFAIIATVKMLTRRMYRSDVRN